jgi:hypothetical protein
VCLIRGKNCLPFASTWIHPLYICLFIKHWRKSKGQIRMDNPYTLASGNIGHIHWQVATLGTYTLSRGNIGHTYLPVYVCPMLPLASVCVPNVATCQCNGNIGHTYTGKWQHWAHIHWQVATLGTHTLASGNIGHT